jgi:NADH-quinone oxidoreductase subunit E
LTQNATGTGTTAALAGVLGAESFARLEADARTVVARYPQPRSALLPLLHLVQAAEGFVSPAGIEFCANLLELTTAEVTAVSTFYTMYKRRPVGDYHVGVCTNTLCAVMGGDAIFAALRDHLDVPNEETTEDGRITLEHIECNAACDYAPVVMVNWEFFDNQTPESARDLVDRLRSGADVLPSRGARLTTFRQTERLLAGFYDGRADEGPAAGPASLAGLRLARQLASGAGDTGETGGTGDTGDTGEPGITTGYGPEGGPSGSDAPRPTAESDPANVAAPGHEEDQP